MQTQREYTMKIFPNEINLGYMINIMILAVIALCGSFALITGDSGATGSIALTAPLYAVISIGYLIQSHLDQQGS